MSEATGCLLLLRKRRRKVEVDGRKLTRPKDRAHVLARRGYEHHVLEPCPHGPLGGVGDADRLEVHTHEEHVGLAARHLGGKVTLAAAEVKPDLAVATEGRTLAFDLPVLPPKRKACLGPVADVAGGFDLDGIGIAFEPLLQDEVLGEPCMECAHLIPSVWYQDRS